MKQARKHAVNFDLTRTSSRYETVSEANLNAWRVRRRIDDVLAGMELDEEIGEVWGDPDDDE